MTARAYVETLLRDAGRIEVRVLPSAVSTHCATSGEVLEAVSRHGDAGAIYTTLNRPHDGAGRGSLSDADIAMVIRLPFDFDPVRPANTSSTDAELAESLALRDRFVRAMLARGWPLPLLGQSGNGAHAVYRTLAPANDETKAIMRTLYRGLAAQWSTETVTFDATVRNPSRIWRLYGTVNRKGPNTPDRPWRVSSCILPTSFERVPFREVERLASEFERRPQAGPQVRSAQHVTGIGDYATLDVVSWFRSKGMYVRHVADNVHEVVCPWEHEHSSSSPADTVIFEPDGGWAGFFCHHAHCEGRTIRDVMQLFGDADRFCARAFIPARRSA